MPIESDLRLLEPSVGRDQASLTFERLGVEVARSDLVGPGIEGEVFEDEDRLGSFGGKDPEA